MAKWLGKLASWSMIVLALTSPHSYRYFGRDGPWPAIIDSGLSKSQTYRHTRITANHFFQPSIRTVKLTRCLSPRFIKSSSPRTIGMLEMTWGASGL